jgi:hypothetical protein
MAARGANVCRVHGGSAPQVEAAARRRLDQAADVLVQRLLAFALDSDAPDNIALQTIRDALDRAVGPARVSGPASDEGVSENSSDTRSLRRSRIRRSA